MDTRERCEERTSCYDSPIRSTARILFPPPPVMAADHHLPLHRLLLLHLPLLHLDRAIE